MKFKKLIIAIDGPAGSGKSSTAKALAKRLKLPFIDTGAMYRAVTLKAMKLGIPFDAKRKILTLAKNARIELKGTDPNKQKVFLDGKDVTKAIRTPELTKNVFHVAQEPLVRREMVKKQRQMGKKGGAVMEGRDIGTKVFPDADFKFYFDSDIRLRARRRMKELVGARSSRPQGGRGNPAPTFAQVLRDIKRRDKHDKTRKEGPLKQAKDAYLIDTTPLTIEGTVDKILPIIGNSLKRKVLASGHAAA